VRAAVWICRIAPAITACRARRSTLITQHSGDRYSTSTYTMSSWTTSTMRQPGHGCIEADIAVAVAVRPGRLRPGVEALAEVVSAAANLDDPQPLNLIYQSILAARGEGRGELACEGRPGCAQ
jgi:hypothetical protein